MNSQCVPLSSLLSKPLSCISLHTCSLRIGDEKQIRHAVDFILWALYELSHTCMCIPIHVHTGTLPIHSAHISKRKERTFLWYLNLSLCEAHFSRAVCKGTSHGVSKTEGVTQWQTIVIGLCKVGPFSSNTHTHSGQSSLMSELQTTPLA